MKSLFALVLLLLLVGVWPPTVSAQTATQHYIATAPVGGSPPVGYRWWVKYGAAPWIVLTVAGSDSTLTPEIYFPAPVGVPFQVWVEAFDRVQTPVMNGEEMVGVTTARRYSVQSPYALPYTPPSTAPTGCGRPVRQP